MDCRAKGDRELLRLCWRHQYLAKSRKTVQKASTQVLGLGQGHLSDQHHFKSICDEHTKVQRYQIIIITISLTLQYRIVPQFVDSKIKCASEAQQSTVPWVWKGCLWFWMEHWGIEECSLLSMVFAKRGVPVCEGPVMWKGHLVIFAFSLSSDDKLWQVVTKEFSQ